MIRLSHVKKTYRKHGNDRIVVANDVSLSFGDTGLVFILGPSGSGKTTLLNIISGMDRFDSGSLMIDDAVLATYSQRRWDAIRRHKIGYVHQNYHLLKERTVLSNIEPVLRMQGIDDPAALTTRVDRLLAGVGLAAYSDRLVKQLSGGQQQRVAFARALANDPEVILADEPTGNLDRKTTIELMNLIGEIAKTRLVIMVTHDQMLAWHYADRIIEIDNGVIVRDEPNVKTAMLEYAQEHVIHLGDFVKTEATSDGLRVRRYTEGPDAEPLDVDMIERNRTLYLNIRSRSVRRTRSIGEDSEIVIREGTRTDDGTERPLHLENILTPVLGKRRRNVFAWKDVFRYAAARLSAARTGGVLLLLALMTVGMIVAVSVGLVGEIYRVEEPYSEIDPHYVSVKLDRTTYAAAKVLETVAGVDQLVLFNRPVAFRIETAPYYQVRSSFRLTAMPIDIRFLDPASLVYGTLPTGYGVVVDRSVADAIIRDNRRRGIDDYDDVLGCGFKLQTSGIDTDVAADRSLFFPITGIADANSRSVWMKEELIYSLVAPVLVDYRILGDAFSIVSGELPDGDSFLMLNDHHPTVLDGGIPYGIGIDYGSFSISGIYQCVVGGVVYDYGKIAVTSVDYIKSRMFAYVYGTILDIRLYVYATDVETALSALAEAGYDAEAVVFDPVAAQRLKLQENRNFYLLGIGGILMSAFCILLIMRSSLIARLYEIGVYRSIGVSRREIRRIFMTEIVFTTTLSSLVGFLAAWLLLEYARTSLSQVSLTHFTGWSIVLGVLGLYAVNLVFGMIPIQILLWKTPSNIMKQSDI